MDIGTIIDALLAENERYMKYMELAESCSMLVQNLQDLGMKTFGYIVLRREAAPDKFILEIKETMDQLEVIYGQMIDQKEELIQIYESLHVPDEYITDQRDKLVLIGEAIIRLKLLIVRINLMNEQLKS